MLASTGVVVVGHLLLSRVLITGDPIRAKAYFSIIGRLSSQETGPDSLVPRKTACRALGVAPVVVRSPFHASGGGRVSAGLAEIASVATIVALASLAVSMARPAHADAASDETRKVTILTAESPLPTNPLAPDAQSVGSATCISCHALENIQFAHTVHARAFQSGAQGANAASACERCHGAGSGHATSPATPGSIITFTHGAATPIAVQTATCLGCHLGGARQHWLGSIHETRGLSCSDCHNPMAKLSPEGLLANNSINEVCSTCHRDIRVKFNRRSHMPLTEGQIACVDCHNPHGTLTRPLLKTDTLNETCYTCHAEKRGPFLFEHAPVRASCLNCHDPHGSNQQTLLVAPLPILCQQCHTSTLHPNDLQTPIGLGTGGHPDERVMGRACITCHTNIHGSNNPSGPKFHK